MQEVSQLVTGHSPDHLPAAGETTDFVPLRPIRSAGHEDSDCLGAKNEETSFQTGLSSSSQPVHTPSVTLVDSERFSKSLGGILGRHFEQLDQSLQMMLSAKEKT